MALNEMKGWRLRALGARLLARDWREKKRFLRRRSEPWREPTTRRLALPISFLAQTAALSIPACARALASGWLGPLLCAALALAQIHWLADEARVARRRNEIAKSSRSIRSGRLDWTQNMAGHWLDLAGLEDHQGDCRDAFHVLWAGAVVLGVSLGAGALSEGAASWIALPRSGALWGNWAVWGGAKIQEIALWASVLGCAARFGLLGAQRVREQALALAGGLRLRAWRWDAKLSARVREYEKSERKALDERRELSAISRPGRWEKIKSLGSAAPRSADRPRL